MTQTYILHPASESESNSGMHSLSEGVQPVQNTEMVQTTDGGTAYNIESLFFTSLITLLISNLPREEKKGRRTKKQCQHFDDCLAVLFTSSTTRFPKRPLITFTHIYSGPCLQSSPPCTITCTLTSCQRMRMFSLIILCFNTRTAPFS